ncbi:unnamed protein product, partial [Chrysoparadoxa australica]
MGAAPGQEQNDRLEHAPDHHRIRTDSWLSAAKGETSILGTGPTTRRRSSTGLPGSKPQLKSIPSGNDLHLTAGGSTLHLPGKGEQAEGEDEEEESPQRMLILWLQARQAETVTVISGACVLAVFILQLVGGIAEQHLYLTLISLAVHAQLIFENYTRWSNSNSYKVPFFKDSSDRKHTASAVRDDPSEVDLLETPFQSSVRLLKSIRDETQDHSIANQVNKIIGLLADPDKLHQLNTSKRRLSIDMGTRNYIENVLQTTSEKKPARTAKEYWKRLRYNVMLSAALSRKASHSNKSESSGEDSFELGDLYVDASEANDAFTKQNGTLVHRSHQVSRVISQSEYYGDHNDILLRDLRDVLAIDPTKSTAYLKATPKPPRCSAISTGEQDMAAAMLKEGNFLLWEFDVFALDKATKGHSLWYAGMIVCMHYNFFGAFQIDMAQFSSFLEVIERNYCYDPVVPNPYHTHIHAADVCFTVAHFLETEAISRQVIAIDGFSVIMAAILHDYRHPGVNNSYLVKKLDELAIVYNDRSVLENFHAAEGFRVIMDHKDTCFQNFKSDDFRSFRTVYVKCIMATDLAHSYEYTSKFEATDIDKQSAESQTLLLQMTLKVADVSHPARPWKIHCRWSELISEEFFLQGDLESSQGLPISPLCDR